MELNNIYQNCYADLKNKLGNSSYTGKQKLTNPFILAVNSEYENADIKVMIFGQETYDWGTLGESVDILRKWYNDFYWSGYCFTRRRGYFWNYFKWISDSFRLKLPDKKVSILWNNIIKVGKEDDKGKPEAFLCDLQRNVFSRPVINSEISILKPDIIIFMTGPNYDSELTQVFSSIEFSQERQLLPQRSIALISSPGLPDKCLRIYHPGYLIRNHRMADAANNAILNLICNGTKPAN